MQISEKAWQEYIEKMSQISQTAASMMQEWINKHGFNQEKEMVRYANALAKRYGEAIGALSCQMYERTAEAQGAIVNAAEPAPVPEYGEVAKVVYGSKKQSEKMVAPAVGRLVKQVGADTTLKNAIRDRAQFAWVPTGNETCAFCIALASRGWQNVSSETLKNGHAEHIHENCDCQYAVRFDDKSGVTGYNPSRYKKIYDSMPGHDGNEKINALRRALNGKNALTLEQLEFIIDLENNPSILGNKRPAEWKTVLERLGFDTKPLGRGETKGVDFEHGGGYKINYRGDGYLQYHPQGGHHKDAYYKLSSAKKGTIRYKLDGSELND